MAGFREGRYSLAADLRPGDAESLRRDPAFAAGYREAPSLSTYYLTFNLKSPLVGRKELRQRVAAAVDLRRLVRQTLGPRAVPAQGWIPPGLLERESVPPPARPAGNAAPATFELTAAVHPIFQGEHLPFYDGLVAMLKTAGIRIKPMTRTMDEFIAASQAASVDVEIGRWYADYPDADDFAHCLHKSREGALGQMCGTEEVDALIAEGRTQTDPQARQAIYRQLEATLARELLLLPLFHEQVYRFVHPDVDGLTVSDWQPIVSYATLRNRGH
jgi:ABC-type oligopeptide transport system substrate-binding subunit